MKKVMTCGYFVVLHKGHIDLFKEARKLGDQLIVVVNNNDQQVRKYGRLVHNAEDIRYILSHFPFIDEVIISEDMGSSQALTLETLKPDIFAKGGDRCPEMDALPDDELRACYRNNIKIVYGVGGTNKQEASSNILKRLEKCKTE